MLLPPAAAEGRIRRLPVPGRAAVGPESSSGGGPLGGSRALGPGSRVARQPGGEETENEERDAQQRDLTECGEAQAPGHDEEPHRERDDGQAEPEAPRRAKEAGGDALETQGLLQACDDRAHEGLAALRTRETGLELDRAPPAQALEAGPAGPDGRGPRVVEALHDGDFGATGAPLDGPLAPPPEARPHPGRPAARTPIARSTRGRPIPAPSGIRNPRSPRSPSRDSAGPPPRRRLDPRP